MASYSAERNVSVNRIARGDWTYNSLALLASRGHADGLPARYFQGDHLYTRVEMAGLVSEIAAKSYSDLSLAEKVAVKALALELRSEMLGSGMSEADFDKVTSVSEEDSAAGLHGIAQRLHG
ncbi:MAG: hypothetical protein Q7N50_11070 [Armatimonadota bacterium]|nr:hypothetical protein [Armatimonadota bacterium]